MKVQWTTATSQTYNDGYNESSAYIKSYIKKHLNLIENNLIQHNFELFPGLPILYEKNIKGAAEDFYIYVHNTVPDFFSKKSGYNVCFSYWETNKIPFYWLDTINSADEMWTTSKWAKEVFINSGVKIPVYDFKLGVNPLHYSPPAKPRWLAKDKFIFLSIGSPSTRKNSQMSVDAFVKLFGNNERFEMIYKSNGPPDARLKDNITNVKTFLKEHPRIKVIDWQVNQQDLASIYDQANCLVYPTSGEGWGLLPFQAIAKGIPTICTNATACTEFAELSVPLNFKWGTKNMFGIYEGCGDWAEPDFDDLCDKMLYIVNNYDEISKKTFDGAQFINQNLTWEHVGQEYVNRLCQISK